MNSRDEQIVLNLETRITKLETQINILQKLLESNGTLPNEPRLRAELEPSLATEKDHRVQQEDPMPGFRRTSAGVIVQKGTKPVKKQTEPQEDWEVQFGKVWMPRIFIVVLLIGLIWGFTAAVQAGWINQPVRIGIGYFGFLGLTIYGEIQARRQRPALGQVLLGGATAVAILTTFAASTLYGLIGPSFAFGTDLFFSACGVYFSLRHHSQALALVSLLAAVLVPFLVKSPHSNLTVFVLYETLASFGFSFYGFKRRYMYLTLAALVVLHLSFITLTALKYLHARGFVIPVILQAVSLISATLLIGEKAVKTFKRRLTGTAWASLALATLWVYGELSSHLTHLFLWVTVAALFTISVSGWKLKKPTAFLLGIVPFWIYLSLASFAVLNNTHFYLAFVLITTAAAMTGLMTKQFVPKVEGQILFPLAGVILAEVYNPFFGHRVFALEHITWACYAVCAFVLVYGFTGKEDVQIRNWGTWFAILVLGLFLTHESQALTFGLSKNTQHMTLSFVWIVYAILAVIYGTVALDKVYRRFGTAFLFVTLSKLVLVDIPAVTLFVRAVLFIAIGSVGVLISRVFYRKTQ